MGANCSCHGLVWVRQGLCPMRLSGGPAHPWRRRRARWRWCRPRPRPRDPSATRKSSSGPRGKPNGVQPTWHVVFALSVGRGGGWRVCRPCSGLTWPLSDVAIVLPPGPRPPAPGGLVWGTFPAETQSGDGSLPPKGDHLGEFWERTAGTDPRGGGTRLSASGSSTHAPG